MKLVVQLADARILAFGVLSRQHIPTWNHNAGIFLHPPGAGNHQTQPAEQYAVADHGVYSLLSNAGNHRELSHIHTPKMLCYSFRVAYSLDVDLKQMTHPLPAPSHANYPRYTPGGSDKQWLELEEEGFRWVGGMM